MAPRPCVNFHNRLSAGFAHSVSPQETALSIKGTMLPFLPTTTEEGSTLYPEASKGRIQKLAEQRNLKQTKSGQAITKLAW